MPPTFKHRRRWLRFSLGTMFVVVAVVAVWLASDVHLRRSLFAHGLEQYQDMDLRKLDEHETQELRKHVEAITGERPKKKEWGSYEAWWVKRLAADNISWVFLEAYPGYDIPDVSSVQIHVFDKNWKRLSKQSFPTGYRMFLNNVILANDNPLKLDLLVATVTPSGPFMVRGNEKRPAFEQGDFQRQYYALSGDQFVLVRMDDDKGRVVPNQYRSQVPWKGPRVPKRTLDEWIGSLRSPEPSEQLATLVWLSGKHLPSSEPRKEGFNQESVEDSKIFEDVRDAADTKVALHALATSQILWVRDYAELVLNGVSAIPNAGE